MQWELDSNRPLGRGGFGRVYEARGPNGEAAAKVIPKAAGGDREQLVVGGLPISKNIVPVHHVVETDDSWVLYMPRAEYSLRDRMTQPVPAAEAVQILQDIARALSEVSSIVVHRDLKPENILFIDGSWALCDFGIARYVEATTAADTLKESMTAYYAAPEQWLFERATPATDVYAFGVIAYELLSGQRPFGGTRDQIREGHLSGVPPLLTGSRKLAWLVSECLLKAPEARPSAANLINRLAAVGSDASSPAARALGEAQSALITERAAAEAAAAAARTEAQRRAGLFAAAKTGYEAIIADLVEFVTDSAPDTRVAHPNGGIFLSLMTGELRISALEAALPSPAGDYDIVAAGSVVVATQGASRGHSLFFANFDDAHHFGWYEMGFMQGMGADFANEPRAFSAQDGLKVLSSRAFGGGQLGWGMQTLDPGSPDDFIQRWAQWFGLAAQGKFPRMSSLPDGRIVYPRRQNRW